MAASGVLTQNRQAKVFGWLCEGSSDAEILANLAALKPPVKVTQQDIQYYRRKWRDEVDAAEKECLEDLKRKGMGRRSARVNSLLDQLGELESLRKDYTGRPGVLIRDGITRDFRETLKALREELGEEVSRVQIANPPGETLRIAHDLTKLTTVERLAEVGGLLADLGLLGPGEAGETSGGPDPAAEQVHPTPAAS
jgi:hypothetical protein